MRRLSEVEWFGGVYRSVYEILALEGRLPPPDRIFVLDRPEELGLRAPPWALGLAVPERRALWFRAVPPHPQVFAHELIHLARKRLRDPGEEEVFGYNLSRLVVALAEAGVRPPANPLRLFEDAELWMLERALREVAGVGLSDVYRELGLPPPALDLRRLERAVGRGLLADKRYFERALLVVSLSDLSGAARGNPALLRALLKLLGDLAGAALAQGDDLDVAEADAPRLAQAEAGGEG